MLENNIRVRFAPSPTGALHIGGARTALFNFLYARHTGGKFLLRIEDTDKERSTQSSTNGIIHGLRWLEIESDEPIVYQSNNLARHQEVAKHLVEIGAAYYCYTPPEELQQERGQGFKFKSKWRDVTNTEPPAGIKPVVRLKMPRKGVTVLSDLIQGNVTVENTQLDDMVLLRSDSTPTYMLASVVDDHDMRISHIIRGDEHFNNAFRQYHLFKAMGWETPVFAHIPLIHAKDGTKLSKRHGAVGLSEYEEQGYLPEAINNYLLRLGFGHGDDEIISRAQAIEWFDIKDVKKSPARLDFDKLLHLNAHYLRAKFDPELAELCREKFPEAAALSTEQLRLLAEGIGGVKLRARTLNELFDQTKFYVAPEPISISNEALAFVKNFDQNLLSRLCSELRLVDEWSEIALKTATKKFMEENGLTMQTVAHVIRALTTGSTNSPGIFEVMQVLGKEKTLIRLARDK